MNNNFGIFLLFSIFVIGLVSNSAFAEETTVDVTDSIDMAESSNSTSTETTTTESNSTSTETTTTESNSTSTEDETMVVEDEMTVSEEVVETEDETMDSEVETMEEMTPTIPSPLKQIKEGTMPENIVCKEGLGLVFKLNGQPACVKTTSIEKLIAWGWAR